MLLFRELSKNIAQFAPTDVLETVTNYSVLRTAKSLICPPTVLSDIPKTEYFEVVYRLITPNAPLLYLEFGVYRGVSIKKWSLMDENPNSLFVGFDSFVGLPEKWRRRQPGYFTTEGIIPDIRDSRVTFKKGWFNQTLPKWLQSHYEGCVPVVHIDSDLHSSALYVLTRLHDVFPQYHVLFDDYSAGEARALRDYLVSYGASFEPILGRKRRIYSQIPGQVYGVIKPLP